MLIYSWVEILYVYNNTQDTSSTSAAVGDNVFEALVHGHPGPTEGEISFVCMEFGIRIWSKNTDASLKISKTLYRNLHQKW